MTTEGNRVICLAGPAWVVDAPSFRVGRLDFSQSEHKVPRNGRYSPHERLGKMGSIDENHLVE